MYIKILKIKVSLFQGLVSNFLLFGEGHFVLEQHLLSHFEAVRNVDSYRPLFEND